MHSPGLVHALFTVSSRRRWLVGLCLFLLALSAGGRAQGPAVPSLLGAPSPGARVPQVVTERVDTLQARPVSVNTGALAADVIDIELTSGRVVRARVERRETHRDGAETWAGSILGEPLSSVTLVSGDGVLQGAVRTLDGAFSIEPADGGPLHVVRLVDANATGTELEPLLPPVEAPPVGADEPPVAGDDGSTIDVLVFYTPSARTAAGSDAAAQTRIALGVSETNTAYANSGIAPRLRLVGAELTSYTESGSLSTDLGLFRGSGDGVMEEVHTRRDALGADMMVLVVGSHCRWRLRRRLRDDVALLDLCPVRLQRHRLFLHQPELHLWPRARPQHGIGPRAGGRLRPSVAVRLLVRLQEPCEPLPHGDGLRLHGRLPARAALLEPERELQRRDDRHAGPARQHPIRSTTPPRRSPTSARRSAAARRRR